MKKRDTEKNKRDIVNALAMILQIGLAILVCMAMSMGIGWYLDKPGTWRQGIVESYRACVRPEDGQNQSKKTGR